MSQPNAYVQHFKSALIADAVNKLLNTIAAAVGMEIYPHKFRHTFCSNLLEKGVDITTVSQLAGHASIETTHKFHTHLTEKLSYPQSPSRFPHFSPTPEHPSQTLSLKYCNSPVSSVHLPHLHPIKFQTETSLKSI